MKSGITSSEFVGLVLTTLSTTALSLAEKPNFKYAAIASMVGSVAYTLARTYLKIKQNQPVKALKK